VAERVKQKHVAPEEGSGPSGTASSVGPLLAAARKRRGWTLQELSKHSGVAVGTLSKVENGKSGASFDTVSRVAAALDLSFDKLLGPNNPKFASGRRSISRNGEGLKFGFMSYDYLVACNDLVSKAMIPLVMTIKTRDVLPKSKWARHQGEEYIYVVTGSILMYTEFYEPVQLNQGDSAYIDSMMSHAFANVGEGAAEMLSICLTGSLSELFAGREEIAGEGGSAVDFRNGNY